MVAKNEGAMSRRAALKGVGKLAAGAALAGLGASGLPSRAEAKGATPLPWPYEKIDPKEAGLIAYSSWYKGFCSFGVASGILLPLQMKIGEPYSLVPVDGLRLGEGGTVGWGTLCGSLMGATVAVGFITPYAVGKQIINELLKWYSDAEMPIYAPAQPRTQVKIKSVSASPLCHISVGKWMDAAKKPLGSPERMERCARVSADVAVKTVSMLNDWKDGKFSSSLKLPSELKGITAQRNCTECHSNGVPTPPMAELTSHRK
jgi:hypothetical protein